MARVGGRNAAMAWIAGVFCIGTVAVLLWFAVPATPAVVGIIGDGLREMTTR